MYICWGQSCLLRCGIPVHNVPSPCLSPNLLPLPSARRAKGCGRQALQLQHGHRGLAGPRWWQAERGHTRLPDLHPAQEHGERTPPSLYILIILGCFFLCAFLLILCVQEGVHQYYSQPLRFNTGNPEVTSYNVTGLQPDTKYKIQVEIVVEMKLHTTYELNAVCWPISPTKCPFF